MRKVKIIPFIIAVLFPLVCTAFIVCYSYGVNDIYTANKNKYEIYTQNKYFDDKGDANKEIEKAVKLDSYKYQVNPGNVKSTISQVGNEFKNNDLATSLYAYTAHSKTSDEETVNIAYTLYVYDILYKNKYDSSSFTSTDGLLLKDNGTLKLVYVKGTGEWANDRLAKALEDVANNGSTSNGTLVSATNSTNIYDNDAKNYKGSNDDDKPTAYRFSLFNSTSNEFYDFTDLSDLYADEFKDAFGSSVEIPEETTDSTYYNDNTIEDGYTFAVINLYDDYSATRKYRNLFTMTIDNVYNGKDFEALESSEEGYRGSFTNAGYSYIGYIWPTLLWQGALTLVVTGILGVLFYLIWQADPQETEQQKNIRNLQKNKKAAVKKAKKN